MWPHWLSSWSTVGTLLWCHPTNHCVTQGPCKLNDWRAGDTTPRLGWGGAIAHCSLLSPTFSSWFSWKVTAMSSPVTVMTNRFAERRGWVSAGPLTASTYVAETVPRGRLDPGQVRLALTPNATSLHPYARTARHCRHSALDRCLRSDPRGRHPRVAGRDHCRFPGRRDARGDCAEVSKVNGNTRNGRWVRPRGGERARTPEH